jgi:hypothetical protein
MVRRMSSTACMRAKPGDLYLLDGPHPTYSMEEINGAILVRRLILYSP